MSLESMVDFSNQQYEESDMANGRLGVEMTDRESHIHPGVQPSSVPTNSVFHLPQSLGEN